MPCFRALFVVLLFFMLPPGGARVAFAQPDFVNLEYQKKAEYLIYFSAYVTWPADAVAEAPGKFVIGILGQDVFGQHLRAWEGKEVGGKRIVVVHRFASMEQYRPCHILFISGQAAPGREGETAKERLDDALHRVAGSPVLIVTESENFATKGSIINFINDFRSRLIKMTINRDAGGRARLAISARLLGLKGIVTSIRDDESS